MRVAIIDNDVAQADYLEMSLRQIGCSSHVFESAKEALRAFQRESYELILLEWVLPDLGGDEVLAWIREHLDWQVPVIFVTQYSGSENLVRALGRGADDFIAKSAARAELLARIQAVLRRASGIDPASKVLDCGHHVIDMERREITLDGQKVALTQKEFDLASFLFRHHGRLLSRAHLMEAVWGHGDEMNTRTLDTHISRLRKKLQINADKGWRLSSVYHHGYRLEAVDTPAEAAPELAELP
ncbi:MAG TPA: response regulator transcription factor [Candidatus Tenderia sp.]|nr:response regulator transcription factor [Candidatus Tenderia sp.]